MSKKFTFYALIILTTTSQTLCSNLWETLWNSWDEEALNKGTILSIQPMENYLKKQKKQIDFENEVFLVEIIYQKKRLKAVFKPRPKEEQNGPWAEVSAYQISRSLDFPNIPPTTIRVINGATGSLQLYVNTQIDTLDKKQYRHNFELISDNELANLNLYYFIFGQWDHGQHNVLFKKYEGEIYPIAIDNEGICNKIHTNYNQIPFVQVAYDSSLQSNDWNEKFEFSNTYQFSAKQIDSIYYQLPKKIQESIKNPCCYKIYQNALWIQYNAFNKDFKKATTNYYPSKTIQKLKELCLKKLEAIFPKEAQKKFANTSYLLKILERRDQILKIYNKSK